MSSTTKPATDADWGEAFERDLAQFLRDRLAADPPPTGSPIGRDAARWAENHELRDEANRAGIGPYSRTEEAVLTEARHALERYALRLPSESKWQAKFAEMAECVGAGAMAAWMLQTHQRGEARPGREGDVLADAVQALNDLAERLPETSPWQEGFRQISGEVSQSVAAHEALAGRKGDDQS